jgi:hypothetical protein
VQPEKLVVVMTITYSIYQCHCELSDIIALIASRNFWFVMHTQLLSEYNSAFFFGFLCGILGYILLSLGD